MLATLDRLLADHGTHWGVGVMGAIGEFIRDAGEAVASPRPRSMVTARGGIALMADDAAARLVAWTEPSTIAGQWRQGAAVCLPVAEAACGGASVITEIGPDEDALRDEDRGAILFDMGVGFPHIRACVRSADPALVATLRAGCGRGLFDADNWEAAHAVILCSPHRVFLSRIARIEVYQPIPPPDGKSPEGPHTHLLPKLLAARRAHSATRPLPDGLVSCLDIFPAHPLRDALGNDIPFDAARFDRFAALLARFGLAPLEAIRADVTRAIRDGVEPARFTAPQGRHERAALKVALRQLSRTEPGLPALPAWRAAFDRAEATDTADDPTHPD